MRSVEEHEVQQHLKNLRTYGYTHVAAYLEPAIVTTLKELVERHWAATEDLAYKGRPARDVRDKVVYNLQGRAKLFVDILDDAFIRQILMPFLNDPYYRELPLYQGPT